MLLHPIRTLILIAVAFTAGVIYEKSRQSEACQAKAGVLSDVVCD